MFDFILGVEASKRNPGVEKITRKPRESLQKAAKRSSAALTYLFLDFGFRHYQYMIIYIRTLTGKTFPIQNVDANDTVGDLKLKIYDQEGIPPSERLYNCGRQMNNYCTLSCYDIASEETIVSKNLISFNKFISLTPWLQCQ